MKKSYKKGEYVEKFCPACDRKLDHVVREVTKTGSVSKVNCSRCGLVGTFEPDRTKTQKFATKTTKPNSPVQKLVTKTAEPYSATRTYLVGHIIEHPKFGMGEVQIAFENTIDVRFLEGVRKLVHSRT